MMTAKITFFGRIAGISRALFSNEHDEGKLYAQKDFAHEYSPMTVFLTKTIAVYYSVRYILAEILSRTVLNFSHQDKRNTGQKTRRLAIA